MMIEREGGVRPTWCMGSGAPAGIVRVLLVAPSLRFLGGQAVQARRLAERLAADLEVEVQVLPVDPILRGLFAPLQKIKYVRTIVTEVAYVASLLRTVPQFDVIQAFSASYWSFLLAPVPAMLIGRLFGKRVLVNYHSGEAQDHLARWGWHAIPLIKTAHTIVVPSGYLVEVFGRVGLQASAIFNFLDVGRFVHRRRTHLAPRFLSNRNFEVHYNVRQVLDAFAAIQKVLPDAQLTVAGDGPLREQLKAHSANLGLRNVTFTGPVTPDAMVELYDSADIYLNAPLIDNMPLSVIEAFASGLPVVTSDAGGIPWIVRDGENGVLVPAGDAEALAHGALSLLADPARALALADRAREDATTRYTWEAVRPQWLAVYRGEPIPTHA